VPFHERRERFASMTANIVSLADSKASRMMRQAILHEMHRPPGDADEPAADNPQQVSPSLVRKTAQCDVAAIKQVLHRIDGKTLPGASETMIVLTGDVAWKKPKKARPPGSQPRRRSGDLPRT
jgi:hypothetical protein